MKNLKISKKKGFSLVELLVVIAVIGVIAAIAIPAMTNVFENSRTAKAKRNAQNIASAFAAARAAGWTTAETDLAVIVADICDANGVQGVGNFATTTFRVSLDPAEQALADDYLAYDAALVNMTYTGTGL